MEERILMNQVGYRPEDVKHAVLKDGVYDTFKVVDEAGKTVLEGKVTGPVHNENAGEDNYLADFSKVSAPGKYYLIAGDVKSEAICVGENVYQDLLYDITRFFYLQRCGCEIPAELGGKFAHKSCHDTKARIYGTDTFIDVNGGWHDAGDYGRYVAPAAMTVAQLLLAYQNSGKLRKLELNIPESGRALPDVLSEIKYELDWMLKMQDRVTGQVYHKVTCASFPGFVMPEYETEELIISPVSVTATATFAASLAMASSFYEDYNEAFSKTLLDAAKKAYGALAGMSMPGGFKNPSDIVTGEYGDPVDRDELYWAAAALYQATGMEQYRKDFETLAKEQIMHGYGWEDVATYGNLAYLSAQYPKDEALVEAIKKDMTALADKYLEIGKKDSYECCLDEYKWGSNLYLAEIGSHLYDAYALTGNEEYLKAAWEQFHYLMGKNPTGYCYVTGYGYKAPVYPHHRPSAAADSPMPGMLVGGPDCGLHDPDAVEHCTGKPAAKCYIDVLGSYSTNEVTIYWNSALIYLMLMLK